MKMKSIAGRSRLAITAVLILLTSFVSFSQDKEAGLEHALHLKRFVFIPQTMTPLAGPSRAVTSDFELRLSGDSLISYLPYFGRAYAPVELNSSGLNFIRTDYTYSVSSDNNGWTIRVDFDDQRSVRQMQLFVSRSGYGTLQVLSNNRQPISYYGSISVR